MCWEHHHIPKSVHHFICDKNYFSVVAEIFEEKLALGYQILNLHRSVLTVFQVGGGETSDLVSYFSFQIFFFFLEALGEKSSPSSVSQQVKKTGPDFSFCFWVFPQHDSRLLQCIITFDRNEFKTGSYVLSIGHKKIANRTCWQKVFVSAYAYFIAHLFCSGAFQKKYEANIFLSSAVFKRNHICRVMHFKIARVSQVRQYD